MHELFGLGFRFRSLVRVSLLLVLTIVATGCSKNRSAKPGESPGPGVPIEEVRGSLYVLVQNEQTEAPIEGAWVMVGAKPNDPFKNNWKQTDAEGKAEFSDPSLQGPQIVTAIHENFVPKTSSGTFNMNLMRMDLRPLHDEEAQPTSSIVGKVTGYSPESDFPLDKYDVLGFVAVSSRNPMQLTRLDGAYVPREFNQFELHVTPGAYTLYAWEYIVEKPPAEGTPAAAKYRALKRNPRPLDLIRSQRTRFGLVRHVVVTDAGAKITQDVDLNMRYANEVECSPPMGTDLPVSEWMMAGLIPDEGYILFDRPRRDEYNPSRVNPMQTLLVPDISGIEDAEYMWVAVMGDPQNVRTLLLARHGTDLSNPPDWPKPVVLPSVEAFPAPLYGATLKIKGEPGMGAQVEIQDYLDTQSKAQRQRRSLPYWTLSGNPQTGVITIPALPAEIPLPVPNDAPYQLRVGIMPLPTGGDGPGQHADASPEERTLQKNKPFEISRAASFVVLPPGAIIPTEETSK